MATFDENGNRIRGIFGRNELSFGRAGWDIPNPGPVPLAHAAAYQPPAFMAFLGASELGRSILDALKTPNKDVDFGKMMRDDMKRMRDVFAPFADAPPPPKTMTGMAIMAEMAARQMPAYAGPDMNEVDAALEAIERLEE